MIGIDHTDRVPPEPAKPILASALLDLEMEQRRRFVRHGAPERIRTGCGGVDEILGGGFERGIVVGISAEGGEGSLVGLHFLPGQTFIDNLSALYSHPRQYPPLPPSRLRSAKDPSVQPNRDHHRHNWFLPPPPPSQDPQVPDRIITCSLRSSRSRTECRGRKKCRC